jgi:hypothetical protein
MKRKVSFNTLLSFQDVLDTLLVENKISLSSYHQRWELTLDKMGYSNSEYERLIDERWDIIAKILVLNMSN